MTTTGARVELIDETQLRLALMQTMALGCATLAGPDATSHRSDYLRVYAKIDGKPEDEAFCVEKVSFSIDDSPAYTIVELDSQAAEYGQLDARIEVTFQDSDLASIKLLKYGVLSEDSE